MDEKKVPIIVNGEAEFARQFSLSPEDVAKIKADLADGIRLEKYFDEICTEAARPSEADAQAYYRKYPEEFRVPERVHAAHIVQHPSPDNPLEKVYAELLNVLEVPA